MSLDRIPPELQALNQWVIWRLEKVVNAKGEIRETKVPYSPNTGRLASVDNPSDWASWFTAQAALAASGYSGLGFVFTANDNFTGIDLDWSEDAGVIARQNEVFAQFNGRTYAELSFSGRGLHFIAQGSVPTGKRRAGIEVYSNKRFFAMTGNVYGPYVPTAPMQEQLTWLYGELGGNETPVSQGTPTVAGMDVDRTDDDVIFKRAREAVNGDKFMALWNGQWEELGYPSQSEADFALIDILGFYSQSIPQIKRLFRMSALGQREKAQSDKARVHGLSYVEYQIRRAFDNQPPLVDTDTLRANIEKQFGLSGAPTNATIALPTDDPAVNPYLRPVPGLLGQIAYYIYTVSPRPVPEIALAAAIGLLAGITGRAWNISGTGLNQYIMLLADTGTGKDAIHIGPRRIMSAVMSVAPGGGGCPGAHEFMGPGDIASGQALIKYLTKVSQSFVTFQGEFDLTLKGFTARHANAAMLKLKQIILKAYGQSGRGEVIEGTIYSDQDKNTAPIVSPAFSIVGEGTPERFYNLLDETLVADGLLPRFTIIHYDGGRVPLHKDHREADPPPALTAQLASLCGQSLMLNQSNQVIDVQMSPEAAQLLDGYNVRIDTIMNSTRGDVFKQIWNRAHLKALKLSALVAVGVNSTAPIVTDEMARYAIDIVNYDTQRLVSRFEQGDVGDSEGKQISDIRRMCRRYLQSRPGDAAKLGTTDLMITDGVIPKRYLQQRSNQLASFRNDRIGSANALNRCIQGLMDAGVIQELGPLQKAKYGGPTAKLYVILDASWLGQVVGEV